MTSEWDLVLSLKRFQVFTIIPKSVAKVWKHFLMSFSPLDNWVEEATAEKDRQSKWIFHMNSLWKKQKHQDFIHIEKNLKSEKVSTNYPLLPRKNALCRKFNKSPEKEQKKNITRKIDTNLVELLITLRIHKSE